MDDDSGLTPEERRKALLEARLGGAKPKRRTKEPVEIPTIDRDGPRPLSAGQQALVFEHHRHPGTALYNVTHSYVVVGELAVDRLVAAFEAVVAAHEPLHTACGPDRRVLPVNLALEVQRIDGDGRDFEALAQHRAETPIDIEQGPLVRVLIASLGEHRNGIVVSMHHVSCDAGSLGAFWRDVNIVYGGGQLSELTVQYSDHGEWQKDRTTNADISWWLDQLGDDAAPADLGFERPTGQYDRPNGYVTHRLTTDPGRIAQVGSRPFPVFLAAYAALLQHVGGSDEPVIGVAMSTRDHPKTEDLVGYFLSVMPFRLPVGDSTFSELVDQVDTTFASGLAKRHVPFGRVAAARRAAGRSDDLLRTMFVFDEPVEPTLDGVAMSGRVHANGAAVAPMTLFVRPAAVGEGWEASLEFQGAVLDQFAARELLAVYDALLAELVGAPDQPVRTTFYDDPNASELVGPELTAEAQVLTERIAAADPETTAVICGANSLTYGELLQLADELAVELRAEGVSSGDRVALVLPRSLDMLVAIVGVLRAGAAYVPIDPTYPPERIRLITEQAEPSALVVATATHGFDGTTPVLRVPTSATGPRAIDEAWAASLDDPAYVIFTSGSTGVPRGVEVSHRNLATSTLARFDVYRNQPERFLLVSSYGFDSSIVGIFWTLAAGGTLVLPSDAEVHDFDKVAQLIADHDVSHLLAVPTLYDALLRRSPDKLASLRVAMVAGEAVPAALVSRHHAMVPTCTLVNEYGPTEATVWATSHECVASTDELASVPIGKPIPGAVTRIADAHGRPLPRGIAGELWIGGSGVTKGYLGDPASSARSFVTDPISAKPMYRSGDKARIIEDNTGLAIEFLGRVDNQLSINGLRVEPEEIESALTTHPAVQAAVVGAPDGRLAVVVESPTDIDVAELREHCSRLLPSTHVPLLFVVVKSLARTPHGKVDRLAAAPLLTQVGADRDAAPLPHDDAVAAVLVVWNRVLGDRSEQLSENSDFFESGGDSLAALQLCEALEQEFGRRIGIGELIGSPTPLALARLVDQSVPEVIEQDGLANDLFEVLRRRESSSTDTPLVLLAPGGGNLLAYQPLVAGLDAGQEVVGFRLPGSHGKSEPVRSIDAQADRILPQLLAEVSPEQPYRLVGWSTGGLLGLELANRLLRLGHEVEFLAMIDTIYPGFQVVDQPSKLSKYRQFHNEGGLLEVRDQAIHRIKVRAREMSDIARARIADRRGIVDDPKAIERRLYEIAFDAAVTYRPAPFEGRVVFYAASGTDSSRTIGPWSSHLSDFEVVVVEGEHAEENAVLDAERVTPLADHLQKQLDGDG